MAKTRKMKGMTIRGSREPQPGTKEFGERSKLRKARLEAGVPKQSRKRKAKGPKGPAGGADPPKAPRKKTPAEKRKIQATMAKKKSKKKSFLS